MIRTNLSTRPFYNVRAVRAAIAGFAALVLALTLFNAIQLIRLSASQRTVGAEAIDAEAEADRLRVDAARLRAEIDPAELRRVGEEAARANAIIDQRTFSFTTLLTQLETTLPSDVRVLQMRPRLERGAFRVQLSVEARTIEDLDEFVEALEATGAFREVLPTLERTTDSGLLAAVIESRYDQATAVEAPVDTSISVDAPADTGGQP